jgi:hypothetical protein
MKALTVAYTNPGCDASEEIRRQTGKRRFSCCLRLFVHVFLFSRFDGSE